VLLFEDSTYDVVVTKHFPRCTLVHHIDTHGDKAFALHFETFIAMIAPEVTNTFNHYMPILLGAQYW
jgi:hypothetical protein